MDKEKVATEVTTTNVGNYKQELPRDLGLFSAIGLGLSIMAVPYGLSTTISIGLENGGPVSILWGWVFITFMSICIALSLAEICSKFPTSGGPYYWAFQLSKPTYRCLSSYIVGWLGLIGNWTVTLSIIYGTSTLIIAIPSLWDENFESESYQSYLIFLGLLIFCFLVNFSKQNILDILNTISIYWTGLSILVILITILSLHKTGLNDGKFVFGHFDSNSGWIDGWSFFVGTLQSAYVLTGYGMIAALCDEVKEPQKSVPKGMVGSVIAAGVFGLIYLIPLLFVMTDLSSLRNADQPIPTLFLSSTGSRPAATVLTLLIITIGILGGIGGLTAASRCCWSFSRDGGVMGSSLWKKVYRDYLPLNSLILSTLVIGLLGLISFQEAAFNAFTGVATITLGASYAGPVFVSLIRFRRPLNGADFKMPNWIGYIINSLCCAWILLSLVIFCMPTSLSGLTSDSMNYASVVFVGFATIAFIWYIISARKNFNGPPSTNNDYAFETESEDKI